MLLALPLLFYLLLLFGFVRQRHFCVYHWLDLDQVVGQNFICMSLPMHPKRKRFRKCKKDVVVCVFIYTYWSY